jgi:hypothetical protein
MQTSQRSASLNPAQENQAISLVKRGIWVYFFLLIFEGAIRKWILPQFAVPLLIVRDPVVLYIYWQALRSGKVSSSGLLPIGAFAIALSVLAALQIEMGLNNLAIAVYGLRSYLLHLPLIFIMEQVLTFDDVKAFGKAFLRISIPMAMLMILQFEGSSSSWVNVGAGGGEGSINFGGGHVRAAGTFSYVTGTAEFFPYVVAFLLFSISELRVYSQRLLMSATLASIVSIPVSGSRILLFSVLGVAAIGITCIARNLRSISRFLDVTVVFTIVLIISFQIPVFQDALRVFGDRWESAAQFSGGTEDSTHGAAAVLWDRLFASISEPFEVVSELPILGEGIGVGSNVGSSLKTGSAGFLLSENEWLRICQEVGPLLGLAFMFYRVILCGKLAIGGFAALRKNSTLSILVAAATIPSLLTVSLEQPTSLGFMVFGAGLALAGARPMRALGKRTRPNTTLKPTNLTLSHLRRSSLHGT